MKQSGRGMSHKRLVPLSLPKGGIMEKPELTMEDLVLLVNSSDRELIIHIEPREEAGDDRAESV